MDITKKNCWEKIGLLFGVFALLLLIDVLPVRAADAPIIIPATLPTPTATQTISTSPTTPTPSPTPTTPDFFSCVSGTGDAATCALYAVATFVNGITSGLLVSLGALLIRAALVLNSNVINMPMVQTGFSVSLAFANLGFVLGIIIIALATILRRESYGVKQLLWKLVAMAILVNFGLVITAPIIGFADDITSYFVQAVNGTSVTQNNYEAFVTKMTTVLSPHNVTTPQATLSSSGVQISCPQYIGNQGDGTYTTPQIQALCQQQNQIKNNQLPQDSFWQTFMSVIFGIILSLIIGIALITIAVLLFVRAAALSILLVLLPLAWLLWIFPKFGSQFSQWWTQFVKWVFFAPLALFFIYLTYITTSLQTTTGSAYMNQATQIPSGATTGIESSLATQIGTAWPIQQAVNEGVIVAILFGGLFAASSLAGQAGSVVVSGAKAATGAVTGYIGKQTKKGARLAYQKAGGEKITKGLREGNIGALRYIPGARRVASLAGAGLGNVTTNEALVEAEKKNIPKDPTAIKSELAGSRKREWQYAAIGELARQNELGRDTMVNGQTVGEFFDKNPDAATRFGQGKLSKDADKALGGNKETRAAEEELNKLPVAARETSDAMQKLNEAMRDFVGKLQKVDMAKLNVNDVFGEKRVDSEGSKALARALALEGPHLIASAMPKMKAPTLKVFQDMYRKQIEGELIKSGDGNKVLVIANSNKPPKVKQREVGDLDLKNDSREMKLWKSLDALEHIIGNNVFHSERDFQGGGGGAVPTPGGGGNKA